MSDEVASLKNTHLMAWLKDGWSHCRMGSKDWAQSYLDSAHDYIEALERNNTAIRLENEALRREVQEVRAKVLEECAAVAEGALFSAGFRSAEDSDKARAIAAAIRALGKEGSGE